MLILKNGHVLDPANGVDCVTDLSVDQGTIGHLGFIQPAPGDNVIDATGCYVVPGLMDHHTHLAPLAKIGLPAEAVCFASGVTTAVDAGSTGCQNYPEKRGWPTRLGVKAYLNVCSTGLDTLPVLEDVDPSHWDEGGLRECFQQYPHELVGLKLRTSAPIVKEFGYGPLKAAVAMGDRLGVPLAVHCTDPPGPLSDLLSCLRPGDVLTHMYMNQGPCLVEDGRVIPAAWQARKRGVLFEAADARLHFGMDVAETAIREGFFPDLLATDLTKLSMYLRPTAFNLAMQISKYTHLGIPFEQTIAMCTAAPAKHLGVELGTLAPGKPADVAVLRPVAVENVFGDRPYGRADQLLRTGHTLYKPMLTVKNGEMVYRDMLF